MNYIRSHNRKSDITIDDIATHAGFSTDYFNRIFFAHTGFNIMEYVRFRRMKMAANLLRSTNNDILDIALDCGYEAHESFSRAFKNQYGMSPSEYRKKYEKTEAYYGDFNNDTISTRLLHEFGNFKIADNDEVIDYLLEKDALRYGYIAVCFRVNGGAALYRGDDFKDGFIWFTEWDNSFTCEIVSDDWDKIAEYKKTFADQRFNIVLYTLESDEVIKAELSKRGVEISDIKSNQYNAYTGELYNIAPIEDISMRLIKYDDVDLVSRFYSQKYPGRESTAARLKFLKHELHQRDTVGNNMQSVFMFGIFKGDSLIGVSDGGLQNAHGFVINNCVVTSVLKEYECEELYQYAFKFVTNEALKKGALPVDDTQTPNSPNVRSGKFNSVELGYRTVTNVCVLK